MSSNLITIKAFLGKYYPELSYSSIQEKYKDTGLSTFFDQRYLIQNNKVQMYVDQSMTGLTIIFSGNEIQISKDLYDHPNMVITNSIENLDRQNINPQSLYNADIFPTMAYLVCQNHTMLKIVGEIEEPIYVKYTSDYESFYNSVVVFEVDKDILVDVVEEIESKSALNAVTNYILHPRSGINLTTFYGNSVSGISTIYRNIIAQDNSRFDHILFGKGSSNVIDENKISAGTQSRSRLHGIINPNNKDFHSILCVQPESLEYNVHVDYRNVLYGRSNVTFYPVIVGQYPVDTAKITVSNIVLEDIPPEIVKDEVEKYIGDILDKAKLNKVTGAERFYNNKNKFLHFP